MERFYSTSLSFFSLAHNFFPQLGTGVPGRGTRLFLILFLMLQFCVSKSPEVEIPITRKEFESLNNKVQRILDILEDKGAAANLLNKPLWDKSDLKRFLNISDRTIDRCTKEEIFKPVFPAGKRPRYHRDEILPLRNKYLK